MKKKIHIILLLAIIVTGIRLGLVFYQRHQDNARLVKKAAPPLNPDYYVNIKKLYPYDLKSAKQLTRQPVWVKVGFFYPFYPYDTTSHHTDFSHEAGKLLPLQKLEIKDVVSSVSPKTGGLQVLAVFKESGKSYATAIGRDSGGDFKFYSDDMFFIEDPHQLYKHWPADIWQAIDQHQVKPGMNELQADFAIGIGLLDSGSGSVDKTLNYPNGGKPVTISFRDGKAAEIRPGPAS
ncbi:MAG: hypothetical protein JWN74_2095 [Acidobacteriaceae bacterium]|nr:hypothetical protein [Acidobacteriaceae bacterium]